MASGANATSQVPMVFGNVPFTENESSGARKTLGVVGECEAQLRPFGADFSL